ncbi:MotA/TolQ/ExbB proton channel family protein [Jeongeupia naejangsanensis]|uniref:MotA/TolQ/ExbB proton channel family protein n=1 Tax=Jeongeupia naejangsanensis TaxID=613195 RepID=A0ABS2BG40_9NEIS|nr:MotA/TolQ/ExbB proton channel family protein [Jeongeupia naejangsanensis]MBM3114584.1 MotA/TolQ/ExbB proton channel family protein [Jeongeupia naejangsanensis]
MSEFLTTLIVDGTLWALGVFSVLTWSLILIKGWQHWRIAQQDRRYGKAFWAAACLEQAAALDDATGPQARLAASGFAALRGSDGTVHDLEHSWDRQELLERHLRQQIHKERRSLESGLAVLASIGSTAPFVGLFGTVFGIIHALSAISHAASASIDVVAGPIGEALIATGVGIAVAVPAVLAYNFFLRRLKLAGADFDDFATDFVNLAQQNGFRIRPAANAPTVVRGVAFKEVAA